MNPGFESNWIKVGEINTHYLAGGDGPPLVLIHGAGSTGSGNEWEANIEALACHHRVYVPDMVGYGKSDKPRLNYTPRLFNTFFEDFISILELDHTSIIGHSLGGEISLDFTLKHPKKVSKLALVDTAGLSEEFALPGRLLFPFFIAIARIRRDHVFVSLMTGGNDGEPVETYMDRLHEITHPTLILWGGWDGYVPVSLAYQAHEKIANSQLHVFKRCWHAPQKQRPVEFNRVVVDFLQQ